MNRLVHAKHGLRGLGEKCDIHSLDTHALVAFGRPPIHWWEKEKFPRVVGTKNEHENTEVGSTWWWLLESEQAGNMC